MTGPLVRGQQIGVIAKDWTWNDPAIRVRDEGARFTDLQQAEEHARNIVRDAGVDAVVVRDRDQSYWVYQIDELTRLGGDQYNLDTQVRGRLGGLQLPSGVTLQSFLATYGSGEGLIGGPERVLPDSPEGREHRAQIASFIETLQRAGVSGSQIYHLRRGASIHILEQLRAQLAGASTPHAEASVRYLDTAIAELRRARRDEISFDELALAAPRQSPAATTLDVQRAALALRGVPEHRAEVRLAVENALTQLRNTETTLARSDRPTTEIGAVRERLERQLAAIDAGRWVEAATLASELPGAFSGALQRELPGYGRDVLTRLSNRVVAAVQPPNETSSVPASAVNMSERLLLAYKQETALVLNAIYADTYAEFVDTLGGTQRIRPDDAAAALLRLNASLWTVMRDLRLGTINPAAFGKANWSEVDARAMYDLAVRRVSEDSIDYGQAIPAMLADPTWAHDPVVVQSPTEGALELKPDNIGWLHRSVYSTFAPNEAAESFEALGFAHTMRDGAVAAATLRDADRDLSIAVANFTTAFDLYQGNGIAANASQAVLAMSGVTGVPIATAEIAPVGATRASLEQQQRDGDIAGFQQVRTTFLVYKLKPIETLAAEVHAMLDRAELNHLDPFTRARLRELTGPASHPGRDLSQRLDSESSSRFWRQMGSEVVQVAAITVATMGVGAVVEGVAVGARATFGVIRAARFVATTVTFTTLSGLSHGHLDPIRYPIDAAMFALLGAAGRYASLAGRLIKGSSPTAVFLQRAAAHTAAVGSATTVLTGFGVLEASARGRTPSFQEAAEMFGQNLIVVSTLHAMTLGIARLRPQLAPGAQIRAEFERLESRAQQANTEVSNTLDELSRIMTKAGDPRNAARAPELAARAEALMRQLPAQRQAAEALQQELVDFTQRSLPPAAAAAVVGVLRGEGAVAVQAQAPRPTFELKERSRQFANEDTDTRVWGNSLVKYLNPQERVAYELTIRDGMLYDASGKPFSIEGARTHFNAGRAIFVLGPDGKLYSSLSHQVGRFHHTSFLAGQPVAGAGELVVENGRLVMVSDRSGHYRPEPRHIAQTLLHLQRLGIDLSQVRVQTHGTGELTAAEFLARFGAVGSP